MFLPVSDASPLIYLARLGKFHLLRDVFGRVQVPPEVKVEAVDRGKAEGYSDAYVIEEAIAEGWLVVGALTDESMKKSEALASMAGIEVGEAQVIVLAKQKGEGEVLIDQSDAREAARHFTLRPKGTVFIIFRAVKKGLMSKDDAKDMLDRLVEANFYSSVKIYRDALKAIEEFINHT